MLEIINRAKWLYFYNSGAKCKEDCIKIALSEMPTDKIEKLFYKDWLDSCTLFDGITKQDFLDTIIQQIKGEM